MGTKVFLGKPSADIKEWIEKQYLTIYKVETTSQYKKTGIYSAQRDDVSKPVVINWGDGVVEEIDSDVSQKFHEYSGVGEFTVKVSNIKTFAASTTNSTWYDTTSQNRYTFKELVNLNKAVTSIGSYAFYSCIGLTSAVIPDSVTSMGSSAFSGCSGLSSVAISNNVTSIGQYTFYNCSSLLSVTIPDSVTSIGQYAFDGCSGLTGVTIGNGVTSIGHRAFYNCSSLTDVTIGNSVTNIGSIAFMGCSSLAAVHITDIAKWCGISFDGSLSNPLYYAHKLYLNGLLIEDLVIPDGVTSIGSNAFFNCSSLTSVTIGNSVTSIESGAFSGCSGLTNVHITDLAKWCSSSFGGHFNNYNLYLGDEKITDLVIPDSVTSIGDSAFRNCGSLTSVTIGNSMTSIGGSAFDNCSSLTSVMIGNSVTSIGSYAFSACSGLTSVTIPDSVTSIGDHAFLSCGSLTSVTIPSSVTGIGEYAFRDCSRLTSVYFDGTTVPAGSYDCFYNTSILNDVYMLNINGSDVQAQLDNNISHWSLGVNNDSTYHMVTIHCKDNVEVVIDPTPSGSGS